MKPITGVDLKNLAEEAEVEVLESEKAQVRNIIADLIKRKKALSGNVESSQKKLDKAKKKLAKAEARIGKVVSGDWKALKVNEDKDQQSESDDE